MEEIMNGLKALLRVKAIHRAKLDEKYFRPQLATLADNIPSAKAWVFESKFDGYRILAVREKGKIKLFSRNGKDWTHRFENIALALETVATESFVIDGEIVVLKNNLSSFGALQQKLSSEAKDGFIYYIFDLPYLNGFDLRPLLLLGRKKILKHLQESLGKVERDVIRYSEHSSKNGPLLFKQACLAKTEGIIAKESYASYKNRRTKDWLKIKCSLNEEFVIGGFTDPKGSRSHFGSLLMGYYNPDKKFIYCGHVGTGFNGESLKLIKHKLIKLETKKSPFANPMTDLEKRGVHYVKPKIVAQLTFAEWTDDERLRHPVFIGLREDKPATEVIRKGN